MDWISTFLIAVVANIVGTIVSHLICKKLDGDGKKEDKRDED